MQHNTVFFPGVLPNDGDKGGGGDLSRWTEVVEGHAQEGRGSSGEGVLYGWGIPNIAAYYCLVIWHESKLRKHCGIVWAGVRKIATRILKLLRIMEEQAGLRFEGS